MASIETQRVLNGHRWITSAEIDNILETSNSNLETNDSDEEIL